MLPTRQPSVLIVMLPVPLRQRLRAPVMLTATSTSLTVIQPALLSTPPAPTLVPAQPPAATPTSMAQGIQPARSGEQLLAALPATASLSAQPGRPPAVMLPTQQPSVRTAMLPGQRQQP